MEQEESGLQLSPELTQRIDAWTEGQSPRPTRMQAIDELIRAGLRATQTPAASPGEKLILSLLCDLNRKVEATGVLDPDFVEQAIMGGHMWAIEWQYPSLSHGHVNSQAHADLVIRILTMWRTIEIGFAALPDDEQARLIERLGLAAAPRFPGWNGESETNYRSIARFVTERMNLFPGYRRNVLRAAAQPMIGRYKQMLKRFDQCGDLSDRRLTAAELADLLELFQIEP